MSKYNEYMQDRSIEEALSQKEREDKIYSFYQALALNRMEGEEISKEEEEYTLYCELNNIPFTTMIDVIFTVKGWNLLDHDKARKSRLEYEEVQKTIKREGI